MAVFFDPDTLSDPVPVLPVCVYQFVPGDGCQLCMGSACNRWVPETRNPRHGTPALREPNEEGTILTGRGVCSDNLRAIPWADPAGRTS